MTTRDYTQIDNATIVDPTEGQEQASDVGSKEPDTSAFTEAAIQALSVCLNKSAEGVLSPRKLSFGKPDANVLPEPASKKGFSIA